MCVCVLWKQIEHLVHKILTRINASDLFFNAYAARRSLNCTSGFWTRTKERLLCIYNAFYTCIKHFQVLGTKIVCSSTHFVLCEVLNINNKTEKCDEIILWINMVLYFNTVRFKKTFDFILKLGTKLLLFSTKSLQLFE